MASDNSVCVSRNHNSLKAGMAKNLIICFQTKGMNNSLAELHASRHEQFKTSSSESCLIRCHVPLLTLRPRLLFTRKGSITLKCLETKGGPEFSWPLGKTAYTELHASRNSLLSSKSPPSFLGGSAVTPKKQQIESGILIIGQLEGNPTRISIDY